MRGKATIIRREQEQIAWLAWHVEALARSKKLPPLAEMMGKRKAKPRKPQDPETLMNIVKLAFGYPGDTKQ